MKLLMAQLLFDRPYNPTDPTNSCNPMLGHEIQATRTDSAVLSHVAQLRSDFMEQQDCLCHGDFSCDNIMVHGAAFKVSLRGTPSGLIGP